jgi:hypothetical protein
VTIPIPFPDDTAPGKQLGSRERERERKRERERQKKEKIQRDIRLAGRQIAPSERSQ